MADAGSEYTSIQPLVYAGQTTALTHVTAKRRAMKVEDTATIELSGVYQRYSAPVFRTGVVGQPWAQLVKRMAEYTLAKLALLYENSRPGRAISDVAKSVARGLKGLEGLQPAGTQASEWARGGWYGYSVGIGFPPDWVEHSIFIDEAHDRPLEEGMMFHTPNWCKGNGRRCRNLQRNHGNNIHRMRVAEQNTEGAYCGTGVAPYQEQFLRPRKS